ncbi:hypothetical protein [Chitinimonas sp.]|uniref:hypothetical protein n=1 Tax=Chitinimonas sp. TaxID=1934313 RepID=UPI0035B0F5F4
MSTFQTIHQALHFAYTIQAYEIGAESAMTKALRRIMMELGLWEEAGTTSTVDFGGLDRQEVRGQCAMIRAMVADHLPEHERWAVEARYELLIPELPTSGWRALNPRLRQIRPASRSQRASTPLVFSPAKRAAILGLVQYLGPVFDGLSHDQLSLMVVRAADRKALPGGCRQLGKETGINYRTFHRRSREVRDIIVRLENQAADRLAPLMIGELVAA